MDEVGSNSLKSGSSQIKAKTRISEHRNKEIT